MAAAKPRERSDQYIILSALVSLDAHISPVTARQVGDLLRLHMGGKAPSNVNSCLRNYKLYVSPADKGPPIKWQLTDQGISRVRELSGLPLAPPTVSETFKSDLGIICALEQPEFCAVMQAFGGPQRWKEVGTARYTHVYRETSLTTSKGRQLRVIGTTSTSMGLTAAAIATTQLVLQFQPRLVAMIGIAAGTRSGAKQYGDVLVADPSIDYNSGKVVIEKGIRNFEPDPYPIGLNPRLRSLLHKYRGSPELFDVIRNKWKGKIIKHSNRLHIGPLGAADQVIDDASRILEIQRNWRKLIGVEMETYGVYRAVHESPDPKPRVVSFKAVCDFASEKTDSWQDYAAYVAAEFAVEFLKREWDSLWPTN